MHSWRRSTVDVVRGGLIGAVEVVPGMSGGTVALIVGVYETIITSAGHVVSGLRYTVTDVPRGLGLRRAREEMRNADWATLVPLAIGMLAAVLLLARALEAFVHDQPELARGLFFGLVAAALAVPISMVGREWRPSYAAAAVVAAAAAFLVIGIPPTQVTPSPPIIVAAAAVAVCALVLPGVSGAFILLTVGLYEPTLAALNARDLGYLGWFILGLVVGLALFVKVLQWLLEHRRALTLAILTGIMAGALRALWPWQDDDRSLLGPEDGAVAVFALMLVGFAVVSVTFAVAAYRARLRASRGGAHAQR